MCVRLWPDAGAPAINVIASLLPVNLYMPRPLWGMEIEKSYDRNVKVPDPELIVAAMTAKFKLAK